MRPVLKVCVFSILPILPGLPACGMVTMRVEPDAAPLDAGPADAAAPDAVPSPPIPDAMPSPDGTPCTFDFDLTAVSDEIQGDSLDYQGLLMYGAWISIYPGLGLGVVGNGPSDRYIDGTEEVTLSFLSPPGAKDIYHTVAEATDADGDTGRGMHELRAYYFPSGQDARYIDGEGRFDLNALFPTLDRATRLIIRARQDGIRISWVEHSVCPPPPPPETTVRPSKTWWVP